MMRKVWIISLFFIISLMFLKLNSAIDTLIFILGIIMTVIFIVITNVVNKSNRRILIIFCSVVLVVSIVIVYLA
ncbi:hypothetical protein PAT3040_03984 [Paenibacillus agaridevorans]|uniref:DUF3953 domain-containing protein n=1 Tax=Paenibacillus agaridevorans TaxID=171404 RepID=A0A2R5ERN4_9BACL|nr:hypothetical protein PAT3040_03984 [Paenibacillus agaridevorans]